VTVSARSALPFGVNVVGFLRAELGLGEIARRLVAAAERARIPTATVTYTRVGSRQEHQFEERGAGAPYDTNILCVNANQLPELQRKLDPELLAGRYSVGVWFWEVARFPASMHGSFELVEEVWVASEFTRAAIAAETNLPVHVVPIPLEGPPVHSPAARTELRLPDAFLFYFSFDYNSVDARKNPIGLVEAFKRAFVNAEGPRLLVKSINGDARPDALERLRDAAAGRGDILIMDGYLSPTEKDALMATCDCYVSLHRSEGLGLTLADAMALGKPVIATGYSGNLMFMSESNSYLVRYELTDIPSGCDPYPPSVEWAAPDLDHAAELMRYVYENPEEAERRGARARKDLLERHSLERTAEFLRERLPQIPQRERAFLLKLREPIDRAAAIARRPPGESLERSAQRFVTRLVRRLLARLLWPLLSEQRELDAELIASQRSLQAAVRDQERRLAELERRRDTEALG
jgi:glycosyltransferase involved in cell wall biosynthesis